MVTPEIIAIRDQLAKTINPREIYLFGSYANDSYRDDSDYDFYIVVNDGENALQHTQNAYASLRGIRTTPVDIIVGHWSDFEQATAPNDIMSVVKREGIRLYAKQ